MSYNVGMFDVSSWLDSGHVSLAAILQKWCYVLSAAYQVADSFDLCIIDNVHFDHLIR